MSRARPTAPQSPRPRRRAPPSRKTRSAWAAAALLAAAFLLLLGQPRPAPARSPAAKQELRNQKKQIRQLQFEQEQVRRQLNKFQTSEAGMLADVKRLVKESKAVKKRERELARQRRRQLRRKAKQQRRIRKLAAEIEENRGRVTGHLRRIYRFSKLQDSATLISLARYKDFFRDSHYLGEVIRAGQKAIRKHESLSRKLQKKQTAAAETLERLAELKSLLAQEKKEMRKSQGALTKSLSELRKNRGLYAKYLQELETTRQGMAKALVLLEQKSRKKKPLAPLPNPAQLRGRLPAPLAGRVIAGFGQRDPRYALKKFQRGLVIRVREGAQVRAVAAGRIVHAGPFRGYQELVVLDHGKGLFTVYGHLEELRVKRGRWVKTGATLGEATYQPIGGAYDIYFEIRMKGEPRDPMLWLRPGSLEVKTR